MNTNPAVKACIKCRKAFIPKENKFKFRTSLTTVSSDYYCDYCAYKIYIKHGVLWKGKRQLIRTLQCNVCADCKKRKIQAVHHKTYKNLFNEPLGDLVGLCNTCHRRRHKK